MTIQDSSWLCGWGLLVKWLLTSWLAVSLVVTRCDAWWGSEYHSTKSKGEI